MNKTTASIAEKTEAGLTIRDITTALQPFATGTAAFNWARKAAVTNATTVIVKRGGRAVAMTIVPVGDHYEGR